MILTSPQNPIVKKLLSLVHKKGIQEHGQCLVSSPKVTEEYILSQKNKDLFWVKTDSMALPEGSWQKTITLSPELFNQIDVIGTRSPVLCVPTPTQYELNELDQKKSAIYCALGDPSNLGALVRSAMAFNIQQMVLLKEACHAFLPRATRAATGYNFTMNFFKGPSIHDLNNDNLVALDMNGLPIGRVELSENIHCLIGQEGQGIPNNFSGQRISIPMHDKVESLNATVSSSILLYEWNRQRELENQ